MQLCEQFVASRTRYDRCAFSAERLNGLKNQRGARNWDACQEKETDEIVEGKREICDEVRTRLSRDFPENRRRDIHKRGKLVIGLW